MSKKTKTAAKPDADEETGAKKKKKGLSASEFQALVTTRALEAENHVATTVAPDRLKATEYYNGKLPDVDAGGIPDDRSSAVLTEVRDTVLAIQPDLLRIFFGSDGVCAYQPVATEDSTLYDNRAKIARQATDYVQHVVLKQDNPDFFQTMHSTFQDGLIRKVGFVKAWWEKSKKPKFTTHTGLDEHMVTALVADDDVEVVSKRSYVQDDSPTGPAVLYDLKLKRICDFGKVRIKAIPCENIIVSSSASGIPDAPVFGYSEDKTESEFVELGYEAKELDDCDRDPDDKDSAEGLARRGGVSADDKDDAESTDETQRKIKYSEIFVLADRDGDGIAELIRCVCAGTKYKVLEADPTDEIDYAAFAPYPEAHVFFGNSVADLTMDIMRINSRILRDVLDGLAQTVKPQTTVVEGQVNLDDVLNPDTSNVIRQRAPGMVGHLVVPFAGKEALPVLDYMRSVREARTGMSDASQGLDPKVLQSTDKGAVSATITKAQARVEMVARIFAEMGMKRLFKIILKLIVANQDQPRTVRLRGAFVPVDPRVWDAEMDVDVDVPLGRGSPQEQIAFLLQVLAKQEQIIQLLGPDNPICNITQYRYTLAKILELGGWANADSFFGDPSKLPPEQLQQLAATMKQAAQGPQPAGPAAPDPAIEQAKIASNEKIKLAEIQFKRDELSTNAQLKMNEITTTARMKALEIQATHHADLTTAQIDAAVKSAGDHLKAETAIIVERLKPRGGGDNGGK